MDSGKEETEVRFDQDGFYGHVQRVVLLPTIWKLHQSNMVNSSRRWIELGNICATIQSHRFKRLSLYFRLFFPSLFLFSCFAAFPPFRFWNSFTRTEARDYTHTHTHYAHACKEIHYLPMTSADLFYYYDYMWAQKMSWCLQCPTFQVAGNTCLENQLANPCLYFYVFLFLIVRRYTGMKIYKSPTYITNKCKVLFRDI